VSGLGQIEKLRYREGEWPGHLYIRTQEGQEFRADKFYYNYLIPFFITQTSLLAVDFTNELTDLSVGDAWSPEFEVKGEGYSVVITRSDLGDQLLHEMASRDQLHLETLEPEDALSMHGHMLDFKKRGAFIRNNWRRAIGLPSPSYGYKPASIPISRYLVEAVISLIFAICRTELSRKIIEIVPIKLSGPAFELMRKSWKMISKPSKRKGLLQMIFTIDEV
jgi:coenzyme F420 hydrogenase subunit beta